MSIKNEIEKVTKFKGGYSVEEFNKLTNYLGETPSIQLLEAVLKNYKAKLQKIVAESLLSDMEELEIDQFENETVKVTIKQNITTKTVDKEKLHHWLIDSGYGDIISENVMFPKGELSSDLLGMITDTGASFTLEGKAPPASVKKLITDRLKDGESLPPEDAIAVNFYQFADVKMK